MDGSERPGGPDLMRLTASGRNPLTRQPVYSRDTGFNPAFARTYKTGIHTARWTPRLVFLRLSVTSRRSYSEYDARPLPSRRYAVYLDSRPSERV